MTELEVLEGTWEELAVHAEILKGRKLRLIVLPKEEEIPGGPLQQQLHDRAARLLATIDNLERKPGPLHDDPYKKAFGEIVAEKHKKIGLKL
jgi:hypothetical protein